MPGLLAERQPQKLHQNRVIREDRVSLGSLTSSVVHPREVYSTAIRESADAVLFVHNHPSGDPNPSEDDLAVTRQMVEVGKTMAIEVLDHIIIGNEKYVSLKDKELM